MGYDSIGGIMLITNQNKQYITLELILSLQTDFPNITQSTENKKMFFFDTKYHNIRKTLEVDKKYQSKPDLFNYPIHVEDYLSFSAEMLEYYEFTQKCIAYF